MASRLEEQQVQKATARARYVRMSPYKARRIVDLIRGRHIDDARRVLAFTERAAAETIAKVLESAVANAEHNHNLPADELVVAGAWVDEGPTLRRYRPRALGRATRIRKRTCHISLVVGRMPEELPVVRDERPARESTAKKTSKKTTAKKTASKKTTAKNTAAKKAAAKKTAAKKSEIAEESEEH
jgi:large subunit ribosomal protein L22